MSTARKIRSELDLLKIRSQLDLLKPDVSPRTYRSTYAGSLREINSDVWNLQPMEVFNRLLEGIDCRDATKNSEAMLAILVSEGLGVLNAHMDIHFKSLSNMRDYRADVEIIMSSLNSSQGKGTFSRFTHALYKGRQEEGEVYNAINKSGMSLFRAVLEAAAQDNPENKALNLMSNAKGEEAELQILKSWSTVFVLLEERHQCSHPFNFIKGNIELAEVAFETFTFIATESKDEKYKEVSQIMRAAIPFLAKKIADKKVEVTVVKGQGENDDVVVHNRLSRHKTRCNYTTTREDFEIVLESS